jgi:hypothetical protein
MNYSTTESFESKLVPGVKYTLRKMSHGRRLKLNTVTAPILDKAIAIQREYEPLLEDLKAVEDAAKLLPCTCEHDLNPEKDSHLPDNNRCTVEGCDCRKPDYDMEKFKKVSELRFKETKIYDDELTPAYVRWGVQSIEGLEIDGEPATVESLIESAPEPLVDELGNELLRLTRMTTEEQLSFKLRTTSDAQVDGLTQTSSAPTAKQTSST